MFLGQCFAGTSDGFSSSTVVPNEVQTLTVGNAVFDEIYVTTDMIDFDDFNDLIPENWTFNTRLHALFENNLYGGNVDFTESIVDSVRIKRKTEQNSKFQTIYERKVNSNEDLSITLLDYLEPSGTVDYAYVPVLSNSENDYIVNSIQSEFEHPFICEKNISYPLIFDVSASETYNYESSTVKPFGRKRPVVIVRGETGYWSGDLECKFIEYTNGLVDVEHIRQYTDTIYEFLTNKRPKLLKDSSGNLRMIAINGNISKSDIQYMYHQNIGAYIFTTKFSWVECGDGFDAEDLYVNDFIDVDVDI